MKKVILNHVELAEINTLDEENHFNSVLFLSGVASILSVSAAQVNMLRSEHQPKSIKIACVTFSVAFFFLLPAILNTLSSSILLIQTATHFLDVVLLSSYSIGITGSWTQAILYLVFLMVPGLLAILSDRFLFLHQPDIIEDDLQLRQRGDSLICRFKDFVAGFAKKVLEGLNEKLRLPICAYYSYLPKGYYTTCLNPNA